MAVFAVIFAYLIAYFDDVAQTRQSQKEIILDLDIHNEASFSFIIEKTGLTEQPPAIAEVNSDLIQEQTETAASFPAELAIAEQNTALLPASSEEDDCDSIIDCAVPADVLELIAASEEEAAADVAAELELELNEEVKEKGASSPVFITSEAPAEEYVMNVIIEEAGLNSLDDLLAYAFTQKEQHNDLQALAAFQKALQLHKSDEVAPYLVMEIANILKNKGAYDEAITVLSDGRNLPGSKNADSIETEFVNTIAYLRIIKNTLLQHRLGLIPYQDIPPAIFKEIDEEFHEWRNLT
ncbi:hypothetical protein [Lucifera butyrica]|uniref:hypothetical protein n=1 Tax=Lucifera butyrica TaxID=1351585 RepID=UPI0014032824|nr:hypothetical protein [Lucifera butyrica]